MWILLPPPGGPDLCALAGFCPTGGGAVEPNLLYLATALVLAGVLVERRRRPRP